MRACAVCIGSCGAIPEAKERPTGRYAEQEMTFAMRNSRSVRSRQRQLEVAPGWFEAASKMEVSVREHEENRVHWRWSNG